MRYIQRKSLSPASVLADGPCHGEFDNYVYFATRRGSAGPAGFFEDIPMMQVVEEVEKHPSWMPWLIDHGYIKIHNYEPCKAGDRFVINECETMLVRLSYRDVRFVYVGADADRWSNFAVVAVHDPHYISWVEFERLCSHGCGIDGEGKDADDIFMTKLDNRVGGHNFDNAKASLRDLERQTGIDRTENGRPVRCG